MPSRAGRFAVHVSMITLFTACAFGATDDAKPDQKRVAQRIVSCAPSTTEILFVLGAQGKLVGVSTACDYPPEAKTITKIGDMANPNLEKVLGLKPDLVVSTPFMSPTVADALRKQGVDVYVSDQNNFADLFASITRIGELSGAEKRAAQLTGDLRRRMEAVETKIAGIPGARRPKVFIQVASDPLYTAGKGSFVDELVTRAGGGNVAAGVKTPYAQVTSEFVVQQDPDFILACDMVALKDAIKQISGRLGWSNIKAVKQNHIITSIDADLLIRPGPRLMDGLEKLYDALHAAD
jgi:iron complex transport system substrate-binding protein